MRRKAEALRILGTVSVLLVTVSCSRGSGGADRPPTRAYYKLSERSFGRTAEFAGRLGMVVREEVAVPASATLTGEVGEARVVNEGDVIAFLNGRAVIALNRPGGLWRDLGVVAEPGIATDQSISGADVDRLALTLGAEGLPTSTTWDDTMSSSLRRWREQRGVPRADGMALRSDFVFGDFPARVEILKRSGDAVDPTTPLFRMTDPDPAVTADLSVNQLDVVEIGAAAGVTFDGRQTVDGEVVSITENTESADGQPRFRVVIRVAGIDPTKVGADVAVEVRRDGVVHVLAVPSVALSWQGGSPSVLVRRGDTVEERQVEVGYSNGVWTEVTDGLRLGDEIVVWGDQ